MVVIIGFERITKCAYKMVGHQRHCFTFKDSIVQKEGTQQNRFDDDDAIDSAKRCIAGQGETHFIHICLYNSLVRNGNVENGMNALEDIYKNLMVS